MTSLSQHLKPFFHRIFYPSAPVFRFRAAADPLVGREGFVLAESIMNKGDADRLAAAWPGFRASIKDGDRFQLRRDGVLEKMP